MKSVEILDCTLRDGGYINKWKFGSENIENIIMSLAKAGIEYIECGFISNNENDIEKSLYLNFERLDKIIKYNKNINFTLMMSVYDYNIENLINAPSESNIVIRLSFHKNDFIKAARYAQKIKEKGYKIFLQPTVIKSYNEQEIINLLNNCNEIIKPDGVAIVDTLGEMNSKDICNMTQIFDKYLSKDIKILFHGHNNFQLAFSNSIVFIDNVSEDRNIIIDTSLTGMGRNSGNVCTELMIDYLNKNYNHNYNFDNILNVIDQVILKLKKKYEWGYSTQYMINAKNRTHPYYSEFFLENIGNCNLLRLNNLLNMIPNNERSNFNKKVAYSILKEINNI